MSLVEHPRGVATPFGLVIGKQELPSRFVCHDWRFVPVEGWSTGDAAYREGDCLA